jgi:alpha-tubulin suppressor-like RCC1 family protein
MKQSFKEQGFALPVILVTATALVIMMTALSQSIMSMRNVVNYSYYSQLSEESAEAGTVYANACLEANARMQTWGNTSTTYLTQSSDCTGNQSAFVATTTGGANASIPIRFSVGNIGTTPYSVNIPARGTATMPGASSSIASTLNRSISWKANLISQSSVSGSFRTCGILSGNVYCWGDNTYGQLGNNSNIDSLLPVKVYKETGVLWGKSVSAMFAAQDHNCAIAQGEVYCWGRNNYGQLGNNTTTNSNKPVKVLGPWTAGSVTAVGGTSYVSCAIASGKIYCWGYNGFGTVGVNTTTSSYKTPTLVSTAGGLSSTYVATQLTSGSRSVNMCAIADSKAYCWGPNKAGQIGNNATIPDSTLYKSPTPVYTGGVLSGKKVIQIAQDGYSEVSGTPAPPPHAHVCAVATDASGANGRVYCWGENSSGQLGNNSTTDAKAPIAVTTSGVLSGKTIIDVAAGIQHSCALTSEGKVACWGNNSSGQIGDNTTTGRRVPTAVYEEAGALLNAPVTAIGGGANRSCAIANQKSYCWGLNSDGQLGDGTTTNRLKPTESVFLRPENNNFIY